MLLPFNQLCLSANPSQLRRLGPHAHDAINVLHDAARVALLVRNQAGRVQGRHCLRQRVQRGRAQVPLLLQLHTRGTATMGLLYSLKNQ